MSITCIVFLKCQTVLLPVYVLTRASDCSGAIDFEEFFAWLNSPSSHAAKTNAKLDALRVQATLRAVKTKSKAVASNLGAAARAAKLAPPKSTKVRVPEAFNCF